MAGRAYYSDSITDFLRRSSEEIIGILTLASSTVEQSQRDAWVEQISILRAALRGRADSGHVYFEFVVPRLGKRVDVILAIQHVLFVLEFKVGESSFSLSATDQVWDYALDLKNFHETSHALVLIPVVVATRAEHLEYAFRGTSHNDNLFIPVYATPQTLGRVIEDGLKACIGKVFDPKAWEAGRYRPTPTIVEAATALYGGHSVDDISRRDADAINLTKTTDAISAVIRDARAKGTKAVCFVTGVPGAGKTLVGLDIATKHFDKNSELYSVFLSGNDPLVAVLREALARDKVQREAEAGKKIKKGTALDEVKVFIQNVHHFRDDCLTDLGAPIEHVALFDEAQRAWNKEKTADFMRRKRGRADFGYSEPEFLISCLDRHKDWAVVVCLVGGGQEIHTGEAGISEWVNALQRSFPQWRVHVSPHLQDSEYGAGAVLSLLEGQRNVHWNEDLHLAVSMRSFRSERVSELIKCILDLEEGAANQVLKQVSTRYPIVLTRDLKIAKSWLRQQARGSERYGIVVSSQAQRLKPLAIDTRVATNPINWFLDGKEDVRSSYYLEDVATEFQVQGLELDWSCVVWDADLRWTSDEWKHFSFVGSRWNRVQQASRQQYLKNAYRVLLTRARQGMVIVVPEGDNEDPTRDPKYYDPTFEYLKRVGIPML
jgi:hypothetical protein